MSSKLSALLGFAAKAGKLSFGFEATCSSIKAGKARLALIAGDISPKSKKEIVFFAERGGVEHIVLENFDIKAVSDAVGRKCGIVSVNDTGFADACAALIRGGNANDKQI